MGYLRTVIAGLIGLVLGAGVLAMDTAQATEAATATALNLRDGPGTGYAKIATMPAGSPVKVKGCRDGWCGVIWRGRKGYASQRGLALGYADYAELVEPEVWPIFPAYPYRSGYYSKADWYFDMPPYTAISPKFYRKRFLMMAQERDRYRYVPNIFRGGSGYYDDTPIGYVNTQAAAAALRDPE
ncbi:SH3 domain-containing protein [Methyloceanibacter sp. wino2]|uniref:SH3 domain-containing protein n=1 Tax=Methyloceanibacter sp. wino2 TaxID=2170729 RepID=UPI000D3ED7A4|nr:SH3 domain-containing protein [Methyloceanibacter sp. wino2]